MPMDFFGYQALSMIAQLILSILLAAILLYAWSEYRRSPVIALLSVLVTSAGLYLVWFPTHSTLIAELVGIGRGVDLILYVWVCITLIVLLNLHLKLRTQMELITALARKIALAEAQSAQSGERRVQEKLGPDALRRHLKPLWPEDRRRASDGLRSLGTLAVHESDPKRE
jgi:small membrane protein